MTKLHPELLSQWRVVSRRVNDVSGIRVSLRRKSSRKAMYKYFTNRAAFLRWLRQNQNDIERIVKVTMTSTFFTRSQIIQSLKEDGSLGKIVETFIKESVG